MDPASGQVYLSVVVPAFNEEKNIQSALERIEAYRNIKGQSWEVLVVDDGSTDKTAQLVNEYIAAAAKGRVKLLSQGKNQGKGAAVRRGVLEASGEYILMTDADLSSPIKESDKLIRAIGFGADVAVGSRAVRKKGCDVQQSLPRRISSRIFNFFVRLLVVTGVRDTQCGFKCFRNKAAHDLFSKTKLAGFCFDVEILYLAKKNGYKVSEVSVMWRQAAETKVRLFRDSFFMLGDLFRIRRIHH